MTTDIAVYRFTIATPVTPLINLAALTKSIESGVALTPRQLSFSEAKFQGHVTGTGFRIRRIYKGRNSFVPWVVGNITRNGTGAIIYNKICYQLSTLLMVIFFDAASTYSAINAYRRGGGRVLFVLIAAFLLYLWPPIMMWREARLSRKLIISLFAGSSQLEF
jgi:hypothetical protein